VIITPLHGIHRVDLTRFTETPVLRIHHAQNEHADSLANYNLANQMPIMLTFGKKSPILYIMYS
jgi:hypothetical protein